ncbi:hypothetical protein D9623_25920 (plasmid) [Azospirillum brasilense]|uniref:TRAP transporter substrate-binding protein n=1 Tax=Azospirillum brasilense TaxID=192 RepID=A0A4D8QZL7_AZOBR|nr:MULTISPECIES: TRAP transporter substrate-binding protein [Azospirillum]MDW7554605.1 TRAP transporter substrate-binding protein [Azospirillum brasilense]MDW7593877.1 TRAP transporter substrate-binding protein [Azospirillum brasilense]MDW7632559.1 TRAP transporter substrate-binding protein [Azospirillum brasilense]MDX5950153.1 TRAP transporter substrate-binding protein [Azospirillum brasilense]NUB11627.1 hypothetical protein [Azospirillum brasilense]
MKNMVKNFAMTCAIGIGLSGTAMAAGTNWDYSTEYAPTGISGKMATFFADKVGELTDGKLKITVHYSGGLGFKSQDNYIAIEDGALILADTPFNRMNGIYPIFDMQSLPFLQSTFDDAALLDGILRPFYNNVMEKNNQFVLYTVPWTPQGIWADREVSKVEDLSGLRIRVNDVAAVQTMKGMGADAIQMTWADTLTALSTGSINAVLTSDDTGLSGRLPEAGLKHFAPVGFTLGLEVTHVNREAFEALPKDQQVAVLVAAAQAEAAGWDLARKTAGSNLATMREKGVSVPDSVSPELTSALKKAAEPAITEWKKRFGPQANNLLSLYYARRQATQ